MSQSMFERYGGFAKLSKVVLTFYDRMIESDVTGPYFENVDMRRLVDHQTQFLSQVMGGPASFTDSQLARYHAHLRIDGVAFDESMELLRETLEDFDMDAADVEQVIAGMSARRRFIVADGAEISGPRAGAAGVAP